jgi:hypothetical protein
MTMRECEIYANALQSYRDVIAAEPFSTVDANVKTEGLVAEVDGMLARLRHRLEFGGVKCTHGGAND